MKDRAERLRAVRQIIKEHRISSQEELLDHLRDLGFAVTQATLSRDLKLLKVGKSSEGSDGYYYTLPTEEELREIVNLYKEMTTPSGQLNARLVAELANLMRETVAR